MQRDQHFYNRNVVPPLSYQVGGDGGYIDAPVAPTFGATYPPGPKHSSTFHGVELQPFEVCPKNFIIFDHTENRSRVMYHPALTQKFSRPEINLNSTYVQDNVWIDSGAESKETSYPLKEDTKDIDFLLSLDYEGGGGEDDEEVSTARTFGSYGSSSSDSSCSSYGSKPSNIRLSSSAQKAFSCNSNSSSSSSSSSSSERKRLKMKKMMKALRGIVPGADQMNSAAVLDEAVKYLKSLKVEVKKLGIGNFQD